MSLSLAYIPWLIFCFIFPSTSASSKRNVIKFPSLLNPKPMDNTTNAKINNWRCFSLWYLIERHDLRWYSFTERFQLYVLQEILFFFVTWFTLRGHDCRRELGMWSFQIQSLQLHIQAPRWIWGNANICLLLYRSQSVIYVSDHECLLHRNLSLRVHLKITVILFNESIYVERYTYEWLVSNISLSPAEIVQPAWKIQMGH